MKSNRDEDKLKQLAEALAQSPKLQALAIDADKDDDLFVSDNTDDVDTGVPVSYMVSPMAASPRLGSPSLKEESQRGDTPASPNRVTPSVRRGSQVERTAAAVRFDKPPATKPGHWDIDRPNTPSSLAAQSAAASPRGEQPSISARYAPLSERKPHLQTQRLMEKPAVKQNFIMRFFSTLCGSVPKNDDVIKNIKPKKT